MKIGYQKNWKGAAEELKDAKTACSSQKQWYKIANERKNVSMAWIDYQKAFDKVPHSWIIKSLEFLGISDKVLTFTKKAMATWKTRMRLQTENQVL